jgi:hypothetical protein
MRRRRPFRSSDGEQATTEFLVAAGPSCALVSRPAHSQGGSANDLILGLHRGFAEFGCDIKTRIGLHDSACCSTTATQKSNRA